MNFSYREISDRGRVLNEEYPMKLKQFGLFALMLTNGFALPQVEAANRVHILSDLQGNDQAIAIDLRDQEDVQRWIRAFGIKGRFGDLNQSIFHECNTQQSACRITYQDAERSYRQRFDEGLRFYELGPAIGAGIFERAQLESERESCSPFLSDCSHFERKGFRTQEPGRRGKFELECRVRVSRNGAQAGPFCTATFLIGDIIRDR